MQQRTHALAGANSGTQRHITSLHYGKAGQGKKVYLQTALHADELPGMAVLHRLRQRLDALQAAGQITGEITLVPMANPIGLDQQLMYAHLGRFEFNSGENFNRHYPEMASAIGERIAPALSGDAQHNRQVIREAMLTWLAEQSPTTELQSLRLHLLRLSCDADVVLDLHCDFEAAMHLYVEHPYLDQADALSRCLGARAVLWAQGFGTGLCFDEALSGVWWRLAERFGSDYPIPMACLSSTVELRGQTDVGGEWAEQDAAALEHYLRHLGVIAGPAPELPPALCQPTPLAGSQSLHAPHAGVVDYQVPVGAQVQVGDTIAWVIEPVSGHASAVKAEVSGCLYARHILRWANAGMDLGKIAGTTAFKSGPLLGP
jgi:uncharacterized protein